jgi:pimeloyl-ACP methyl ester carboxylesterase
VHRLCVLLLLAACAGGFAGAAAGDTDYRTAGFDDGTELRYAQLEPRGVEPGDPAPLLVALPPGDGSERLVEQTLDIYWGPLAARGWRVVLPVAPPGRPLHQPEGAALVARLVDRLLAEHAVPGGKLHLAGVSNGGKAAFLVALERPDRIAHLLVLPGVPPRSEDVERLERLAGVPVTLLVGEKDTAWQPGVALTAERLREAGAPVRHEVLEGQGHAILGLGTERLAAWLEHPPAAE